MAVESIRQEDREFSEPYLALPGPDGKEREVTVRRGVRLTIGRSRKRRVEVYLNDRNVSGEHAVVYRNDEGVFVEDRDSVNGTFLDEKALAPGVPERLSPGARIRVGTTVLRFGWYPVYTLSTPPEEAESGSKGDKNNPEPVNGQPASDLTAKIHETGPQMSRPQETGRSSAQPVAPSQDALQRQAVPPQGASKPLTAPRGPAEPQARPAAPGRWEIVLLIAACLVLLGLLAWVAMLWVRVWRSHG